MSLLPIPFYPEVETVDEQGNEFVQPEDMPGLQVFSSLQCLKRRRMLTGHHSRHVASLISPQLEIEISSRRLQIRTGSIDDGDIDGSEKKPNSTESPSDSGLSCRVVAGHEETSISQQKRRSLALDKAIAQLDLALRELEALSSRSDGRQSGGTLPGLFDLLSTRSSSGTPRLALEKFGVGPASPNEIMQHLSPAQRLKRKQEQMGSAAHTLRMGAQRICARSSTNQRALSELRALGRGWRVLSPKSETSSSSSSSSSPVVAGRLVSASDPLFVDCSMGTVGGAPPGRGSFLPLYLPTLPQQIQSSHSHSSSQSTMKHSEALSVALPAKADCCTLVLTLEGKLKASSSCTLQSVLADPELSSSSSSNSLVRTLQRVHDGILAEELFRTAKAEAEAAPDERRLSRGAMLSSAIAATSEHALTTTRVQPPTASASSASSSTQRFGQGSETPLESGGGGGDSQPATRSASNHATFLSVVAVTDTTVEVEVDSGHTLRLGLLPMGSTLEGVKVGADKCTQLLLLRALDLLLESWARSRPDHPQSVASAPASSASPHPPQEQQGGGGPLATPVTSGRSTPPRPAPVADSDEMHRKAFAKQYGGLKGPLQKKRDKEAGKKPAPPGPTKQQGQLAEPNKGSTTLSRSVLRPLVAVARHELMLEGVKEVSSRLKWWLDGPLGLPHWAPASSCYLLRPPLNNNQVVEALEASASSHDLSRWVQVGINGESGRLEVDLTAWISTYAHAASPLQMDPAELRELCISLQKR